MDLPEQLMWVVVAIVCILVLIAIAWNILKQDNSQGNVKIQGDKKLVISNIINLIYRCFENNAGNEGSVICFRVDFESTENISSSDILNSINPSRLNSNNVKTSDLGSSGKIIIRYENQLIYIKKVESEGTSL